MNLKFMDYIIYLAKIRKPFLALSRETKTFYVHQPLACLQFLSRHRTRDAPTPIDKDFWSSFTVNVPDNQTLEFDCAYQSEQARIDINGAMSLYTIHTH